LRFILDARLLDCEFVGELLGS